MTATITDLWLYRRRQAARGIATQYKPGDNPISALLNLNCECEDCRLFIIGMTAKPTLVSSNPERIN